MNKETFSIYSAGLIQGIALVAFPAASTILTNPEQFNFSSTAYGSLFIPQSLLSITAAALNPKLSSRLSSKVVFLIGLFANLFSMVLLALSSTVMHHQTLSYGMLLVATGCLGLGFGLVVPTINAMAALLFPKMIESKLLILNALLGVGTALAPVFISFFAGLGFWWGLPALLSGLLILLLLFSWDLLLPGGNLPFSESKHRESIPARFWIFASFALLYGIIETLNGNWVAIYMREHLHATLEIQSLALTAFWGMVTFGRVFFAAIEKFVKEQLAFQISPFVSAFAFVFIAMLPQGADYWAIVAFGLTGLGCSTLLPLIISFGSEQLKTISSSVPGMVISFYLLGYGIAAFGVGPLEEMTHINLREVYIIGAVIAFVLGIISLFIVKTEKDYRM